MFKISLIIIFNILLVHAEIDNINGQCDLSSNSCSNLSEDFDGKKLLFYDVNPSEGFNLRRDVYMRFAIMMAEARKSDKYLNWHLVLPPWNNLVHWRSETYQSHPWGTFFDLESLKSYAPVIELYETFNKYKKLEIDILFVLQNYEDAFENGDFRDKWEITGPCSYDGFGGYDNITVLETVCVKYQGKISQLWELIALHPSYKRVMFHHGEIPLHDHYGTKTYWDCRKSMKFNKKLVNFANKYIENELGCKQTRCGNYLAIHWRRQDFARYRTSDVPSLKGTVKQIHETNKNKSLNLKDIFIASDSSFKELEKLKLELNNLGYNVHYYLPTKEEISKFKDGGVAIIDQIVCSRGAYFIGTHESTFTFRIQEEREILGFNSKTTFNRFCPDTGKCERPSRWTIVH